MHAISNKRFGYLAILLVATIMLATATTYAQVNFLSMHFIRVQAAKVHAQMLQGIAGNPWQYRILADWLLQPLINGVRGLGIPQPEAFAFIAFRFLQCVLIVFTGGLYYRRLGLSLYESLIGLSILAWSMSFSLYNSDLSFNVFFDVAFYLLAAILIMDGKYVWLAILMIAAALNRETSLLIPFMGFAAIRFGTLEQRSRRRAYIATAAGLLIFALIFISLRLYYGKQPFLTADGYYPGIGLLVLNLQRWATWEQLALALGVIPVLALFAYRYWPRHLKIFFWVVVPVWIAVHFLAALVAETRLLLVPQALVFIPGALFDLAAARREMENAERTGRNAPAKSASQDSVVYNTSNPTQESVNAHHP